jgi:hypothetical protein
MKNPLELLKQSNTPSARHDGDHFLAIVVCQGYWVRSCVQEFPL